MLAGSIYFCIRRERHHAVGLAERGPGYARRGAERQRQLDAGKGILRLSRSSGAAIVVAHVIPVW